jgi:hypothetical protein
VFVEQMLFSILAEFRAKRALFRHGWHQQAFR